MRSRSLPAAGGVVAIAATLLAAPPASAAVEPPALPVVRPASAITMPTQYPFQPDLRVFPDMPADASIARGVRPYDEIAPFLNDLMDRSDRVSSQVVGTSAQGRDIYLVTVTASETPAETAQQAQWRHEVKYEPAAAAEDAALAEGYKVPLWFNANIHGNEWEGTDATLNYIEDLATGTDPETVDLLDEHRIYFTVTNNPDGRALGQRAVATGYDANRDFITGATAEASIVRDLSSIIQPTYFIDLHGYTSILQVEPCGPPHGENYEYDLFVPHAYATALEIERRVAEADIEGNTYQDAAGEPTTENTGKILIPYRDIRAGWDDWPPIFAPQYVAYQGAVTNTVELPLGRITPASDPQNARNAAINIEVAEVVIDTTADYVQDNSASLLDNQIEIFRRGLAGEPSVEIPVDVAPEDLPAGVPSEWTEIWNEDDVYTADFPRAYVIPQGEGQRSDSDAQTLVQQLLVHGIEVERTTAPFTAGGVTYPAGSFYVDMHQPLRGLANVLLDEGTDISERVPSMYDISAWSLSLLWGADVDSLGDTTDAAPTTALAPVAEAPLTGSVAPGGDYLAFEARGLADYQAINELLGEGIALAQAADGTVIFRRSATADAAALAVAGIYGVDFSVNDGAALRAEGTVGLRAPRIAYVATTDDRDALTKLGFTDLVPVTEATLLSGAATLDDVDVLWVGGSLTYPVSPRAWTAEQSAAGRAIVQAAVDAGLPMVGHGLNGAGFATSYGVADFTAVGATGGSNGIVSIENLDGGVLADYPQDTAFVSSAVWFTELADDVTVERTYTADPFISGHWAATPGRSTTDAAGQPAAVSVSPTLQEDGTVSGPTAFLFGTTPTFRNHPVGAFSDVARALFWATEVASAVVPPVTEDDLDEAGRGSVDAPEQAVVGSDIVVTVSGAEGETLTAYLFPGGRELGSAPVVDGAAVFTIPADATVGDSRLALVDADGLLVGWDDIELTAVPVPGETPTATPTPVPTPVPAVTAAPAAVDPPASGLASTGGADAGPLWIGAVALMLVGAGLFTAARVRSRRTSA